MEFTLTISGGNPSELQSLLAQLSNAGITAATGTTKKSAKATQSDDAAGPAMPASEVSAPVTAASTAATPAATSTDSPKHTIEAVRAAVTAKAKDADSKAAIKSLLGEFNADSVSKLDAKHYDAFMEKLSAL